MASNAIESQGVTLTWDGTTIGEVTGFSGPGGSASIIDVSHLGSTRREKRMGLPDEGQLTLELNLVPADAGQIKLREDRADREKRTAELYLTDQSGTILTFDAFCTQFSIQGGTDAKISGSVSLEITGKVVWSPRLVIETAYTAGVLVLGIDEGNFAGQAAVENADNWQLGFGTSGLTLTSISRNSDTEVTITYNTGSEVSGSHTLTVQAKAAALAGTSNSGILRVPIVLS